MDYDDFSYLDIPVQLDQTSPSGDPDFTQLIEQVERIDSRLDNISNLLIISMLGLGLICGILLSQILARYFMG